MVEPIAYREFDGKDGLKLSNGLLVAYRDGEEVCRAEVAPDSDPLEILLATYKVPEILASATFSYDGTARSVDFEATVEYPLPASIGGHLRCEGQGEQLDGYWSAERRGANRFLLADRLPLGVRDYVVEEKPGYGWRIELPGYVREFGDPVISKRVGVHIERLIYRLLQDKVDAQPYAFRVDNRFSLKRPMWAEGLPFVIDHPDDRGK